MKTKLEKLEGILSRYGELRHPLKEEYPQDIFIDISDMEDIQKLEQHLKASIGCPVYFTNKSTLVAEYLVYGYGNRSVSLLWKPVSLQTDSCAMVLLHITSEHGTNLIIGELSFGEYLERLSDYFGTLFETDGFLNIKGNVLTLTWSNIDEDIMAFFDIYFKNRTGVEPDENGHYHIQLSDTVELRTTDKPNEIQLYTEGKFSENIREYCSCFPTDVWMGVDYSA